MTEPSWYIKLTNAPHNQPSFAIVAKKEDEDSDIASNSPSCFPTGTSK